MKSKEQREQELKQKYEEKLLELRKEVELTALLPIQPNSFCGALWKAPYITYRNEAKLFPNNVYTLDEAMAMLEEFRPYIVQREAWRGTFLTILPASLQKPKDIENSTYQYNAEITLRIEGGDGYSTTSLEFYICIQGNYFKVHLQIQRDHRCQPRISRREDYRGRLISMEKTPAHFGEDHFTSWGTGSDTSYHYDYHFETLDSFLNWVDGQKEGK